MIKHIQSVSNTSVSGLLAQAYPQIKRDFGALVEPFTLHAPAPRLLAGVWMATREATLTGKTRREIKEAVAATVSRLNQCPYCVDGRMIRSKIPLCARLLPGQKPPAPPAIRCYKRRLFLGQKRRRSSVPR